MRGGGGEGEEERGAKIQIRGEDRRKGDEREEGEGDEGNKGEGKGARMSGWSTFEENRDGLEDRGMEE